MTEEVKQILVCALAVDWDQKAFPDNKLGNCSACGETIIYRPDVPEDVTKMCMPCGFSHMKMTEEKGGEVETAAFNREEIKRKTGATDEEIDESLRKLADLARNHRDPN